MRKGNKLIIIIWLFISFAIFAPIILSYNYTGYHWNKKPVYFEYLENGSPITNTSLSIGNSADTWNSAGANFAFAPAGGGSCDEPEDGKVSWGNTDGGAGSTQIIESDGHKLLYMQTWLWPYENWSTTGEWNKLDLQSVMTHEFGHWLQLGDVTWPNDAVMYYEISYGEMRRSLSQDDINGIRYIYPSTSSLLKNFIAHHPDKRLWEFVDGQLFREQNGCADFYYNHDLELRIIIDENPELRSRAYEMLKRISIKIYGLLNKDGILIENKSGPILHKSDADKIIALMKDIKAKSSKNLASDIDKFIIFIENSIGKNYVIILRDAIKKTNNHHRLDEFIPKSRNTIITQNYPNPFNSETKIIYLISKPCHVKICIYDINGREIKTLVNHNENNPD